MRNVHDSEHRVNVIVRYAFMLEKILNYPRADDAIDGPSGVETRAMVD